MWIWRTVCHEAHRHRLFKGRFFLEDLSHFNIEFSLGPLDPDVLTAFLQVVIEWALSRR